ncbi:Variant surface glycoprotein [Trypanosoma congolense IL3000]|uniref:Variant surface glycoprotein n=1 Tax=Trypanosoma congolense (strain IL3000) TaxID=1068625 RepID=F9W8Q0_TRYCI|nr:Variant surface glycoprotein [Trypanosoma congolense IL3000]
MDLYELVLLVLVNLGESVDLSLPSCVCVRWCVGGLWVRNVSFLFCLSMKIKETWIIRKDILAIVVFMAMVMEDVRVYSYPDGTVFNDGEYKALCDVFQASLDLWNASRTSEKGLDKVLEASLLRALFWNTGNKHLNGITDTLTHDYKKLVNRGTRCGGCQTYKFYFPGSSITHDLMCLCTPEKDAEPFYGYYWFFYKENGFKLCGKGRAQMGVDLNHGWYVDKRKKGNNGLEKPWRAVFMGCFNGWKRKTVEWNQDIKEKVKNLNATMQNFTGILKQVNGNHKLCGFNEHNEADGSTERHMHARYDTCTRGREPWWKKLNEALNGKKPEDLLRERSANQPAPAAGEDTGEEFLEDDAEEEGNLESEGSATQAGSPSQGSSDNSTQTINQSSSNSTIGMLNTSASGNSSYPRFEMLRSNTLKTFPCSWLLGANFFI